LVISFFRAFVFQFSFGMLSVMRSISLHGRCLSMAVLLPLFLSLGCGDNPSREINPRPEGESSRGQPVTADQPKATPAEKGKKALLGKDVWLENLGGRRRVLVQAVVCLREGMYGLECLLCKKNTKEHESILSTEADARVIDAALRAAGATPGSPVGSVERDGKFVAIPPNGPRIKILLEYKDKGKTVTVPAQEWVRSAKTKKALREGWVFAGSQLLPDPFDEKKPLAYGANLDGSYINILNMSTAMLDLPINQPNQAPEEREFQPYTEHIPPLQTKVMIILELEPPAKNP
jgi:hypothetical protein